MEPYIRMHAYVSGRVQGVFFRDTTQKYARQLGLGGFVKNLEDGRLEVEAEGPLKKIEKLEEFLKIGPRLADVKAVEILHEKRLKGYDDFEIRY